jgi:hypothetical protein
MKERLPKNLLCLDWGGGASFKGIFPDDLILVCPQQPPDYFPHAAMHVVSARIKEILERERASVEFFRLSIQYRNKILGNHFIWNLLNSIDCLDAEKTTYTDDALISHSIKRLALRNDAIRDNKIFHIRGTTLIGVDDHLATQIEDAGCTGVRFPTPEQWRNPCIPGDRD